MYTLLGVLAIIYMVYILPIFTKSRTTQEILLVAHITLAVILIIIGVLWNSPIILLGIFSILIAVIIDKVLTYIDLYSVYDYVEFKLKRRIKWKY